MRLGAPHSQLGSSVLTALLTSWVFLGCGGQEYARSQQEWPPIDSPVAFARLRAQAEGGDPGAQTHLATLYFHGTMVEKDDELAASWYRKAAEQGDAEAQSSLGAVYGYGAWRERSLSRRALHECALASNSLRVVGSAPVLVRELGELSDWIKVHRKRGARPRGAKTVQPRDEL